MDFETFKMAIDAIQKHREQQEKVTNFIESEICTESWAFCTFGDNLSDALLKVLEHVFNDKGEWISWWLYEDVEKIVTFTDSNKKLDITKIEDLYNFLLSNKVHNDKEDVKGMLILQEILLLKILQKVRIFMTYLNKECLDK